MSAWVRRPHQIMPNRSKILRPPGGFMKGYLVILFVLALSLAGFAHAQCAAFPCVVATVSLTNQSANIPMTPIFTPASNGCFRVAGYISTSNGTRSNAIWTVDLGFTDNN